MSGLLSSRKWEILSSDAEAERRLVSEEGIPPLVARVLAARGMTSAEEVRRFLSPSLERDWADPLDIPGMKEAVDRVEQAVRSGESIAVFGDFDVDGMSATCLLTLALRELGATVFPYIPYRFGEGYGLSEDALARVRQGCDPSLVITVDNGIASGKEVAWLLSQGVDVVVTDHHEPGDLVPQGVPVTDPKLEPNNYSRELAGAGVALKLVCELGRRMGAPNLWRGYTEVATLGTVSDMMLLEGENRALVADGIERMRRTGRPGIVALAATSNIDLSTITADALPFSIVPRLNAAGRMGTTDIALDLLLSNDPAEAAVLAARLEQINTERRETESVLTDAALAKVKATYDGGRVVVVGGEGWHEGVKGIVASRIVNRYHVPTILFTITDGIARGSGRTVGSVDLFHAVEQCSDLLVRFGGHAGAVGVTCEEKNLDAFRKRLDGIMRTLPEEQFESRGEVTALVTLDELTCDSIASLEMLQPFGQGNKKPLFGVRGACMRNRSRVGVEGSHLRFIASDGIGSIAAIMFRAPQIERAYDCDEVVDLVFEAVNETWQGRTKPKLMVKDIVYREPDKLVTTGELSLADELLGRAEEVLARDEYAGIADAQSFNTKAVGVTFGDRQSVVATLSAGQSLVVRRDAHNEVDENAIALDTPEGRQVGFLRRQISAAIAPLIDGGVSYTAHVLEVTGGTDGRSLGVNVHMVRVDATDARQQDKALLAARSRAALATLSYDELTDRLRALMIGEHSFLPAQGEALDALARGRSTLAVMATGRGKSLIFHIHAAREALIHQRASVFVYPLRALVADQAYHLSEAFGAVGMSVRVLTGETPLADRDETFSALRDGSVDVLLTTPEFLAIHAKRFAEARRVGFVVVDEAHHAGMAKGGSRSSYLSLPEVLSELGHPVALAVSATASDEVAREICGLLDIDERGVVVDQSVRSNLSIRDCRELRDRDAALVTRVATGEKTVIYVNSREQSVALVRMLRRQIPELAQRISFYNAGLTRSDRTRVEQAFRDGTLCCIVSTSAFGEGVNLPDIRNVMLYHLPFGEVEFNQMSGRAGRDGLPAQVWMLFGERDARINERIIASSAPEREDLVTLYRTLRSLSERAAAEEGESSFTMQNAEIAQESFAFNPRSTLDDQTVSAGISIFRELGLLETTGYGSARRIKMSVSPGRVDLEASIRYLEGLHAREEFARFRDWALEATPDEMLSRVNRPITPGFGRVVDR